VKLQQRSASRITHHASPPYSAQQSSAQTQPSAASACVRIVASARRVPPAGSCCRPQFAACWPVHGCVAWCAASPSPAPPSRSAPAPAPSARGCTPSLPVNRPVTLPQPPPSQAKQPPSSGAPRHPTHRALRLDQISRAPATRRLHLSSPSCASALRHPPRPAQHHVAALHSTPASSPPAARLPRGCHDAGGPPLRAPRREPL
jgi:hypothetical protein